MTSILSANFIRTCSIFPAVLRVPNNASKLVAIKRTHRSFPKFFTGQNHGHLFVFSETIERDLLCVLPFFRGGWYSYPPR